MLSFRTAVLLGTAACAGARTQTIDDMARLGAIPAEAKAPIRPEDESALAERPTLEVVLRLARARSPELHESRQRAVARARMAEVEEALPPPRLKYEHWHVPLAKPGALDEAMMIMVGVEQEIPPPGSRAARADAALAMGREGLAEAGVRELDLARRAKRAFIEYQEVRREIALHQEHLELARGLIDATRSAYASGRGTQQAASWAASKGRALTPDTAELPRQDAPVPSS
jgi:hypothetical protein